MAGLFGIAGALAGLGPKRPDVPGFTPIDVQKEQQKAITGNLAALPGAESLASALNMFNADQLQALLTKAIPNYAQLQQKTSANILDMLQGKIPDATQRSARSAEKALRGGYAGGGAARNLELRDLNIDALQYTQAGLDAANRWVTATAGTAVPQLASPSSMFVSPAQQIEVSRYNTEQAWNRNWLANRIEAQPSYLDQQITGTLDYFDSLGKTALSAYLGGVAGGGMGGGGGMPTGPSYLSAEGQQDRLMFGSTPRWGSMGGGY